MSRFFVFFIYVVVVVTGCRPTEEQKQSSPPKPLMPHQIIDPSLLSGIKVLEEVESFLSIYPRVPGSAKSKSAVEHICQKLKEIGWAPYVDEFTNNTPDGIVLFRNILIIPENAEKIILIASHFDTKKGLPDSFRGANDSGSSTGLLIELARVLKEHKCPSEWGFILAFLDGEESFENYSAPNFTVYRNISTDTGGDWERKTNETAGNGSKLSPTDGSYLVKGAFWEWDFGWYADIVTINPMDFSTPGSYILTFDMFHERLFNQLDRLEVWGSENGTDYVLLTAGALNNSVYRYDFSLGSDAPVWKTHYVDLSQYQTKGTVFLKLRAISAGELGGNVVIDNLKVTRY